MRGETRKLCSISPCAIHFSFFAGELQHNSKTTYTLFAVAQKGRLEMKEAVVAYCMVLHEH
jgi:hypothetical protein